MINVNYIKSPARIMICAPSMAGKTVLTKNLIKSNIFYPAFDKIYYCYSYYQPIYNELKQFYKEKIIFIEGFTDNLIKPDFIDNKLNNCIVLDDQLNNVNPNMQKLFLETSHHQNATIILLSQSLYPPIKLFKTISTNCTHIILLASPRDKVQISTFARQIFPLNWKKFMQVYSKVTSISYGHVLVDLLPYTPDELRVSSNIISTPETPHRIYYPLEAVLENHYILTDDKKLLRKKI